MTNASFRLRRHFAALVPALALGCAGGQTGEESSEPACHETRAALEGSEDSPLGFGSDEVLAAASANHTTLEWLVTDPQHGPESGTAELTLSLDALDTAAFVTSRNPNGEETYPCFDHVEVDVVVTLATSGGALSETFDAKLRATEATSATLLHVFEDGDVDGTLSFDAASLAGRKIKRITFDASFGADTLSGTLSAGVEQSSGDVAGFGEVTIACFGATDLCPQR